MLNGLAPLFIFNFKKLAPQFLNTINAIPLLQDNGISIPLVPIPVYLHEALTGIVIVSESKNIDIRTDAETKPNGETPNVEQKGINSSITINMTASSSSIGLSVLLAMSDQIFQKVTSQEYTVSYINKAVTAFNCLLDSFSVQQSENDDAYHITVVISKATGSSTVEKAATLLVPKLTGAAVLGT